MSQLPMPVLLGVCGRMHSGKDTLGRALVERHDYKRMAFADKVKEAVVALDPMLFKAGVVEGRRLSTLRREGESAVELCDRLKNEIPEVRRLLQAMGNDVGRALFGVDFWINQVLNDAEAYRGRVVITDVRYPNECARIQEAGGVVLRVTRPGFVVESSHDSEVLVDEVKPDFDVINDDTIGVFLDRAMEALTA